MLKDTVKQNTYHPFYQLNPLLATQPRTLDTTTNIKTEKTVKPQNIKRWIIYKNLHP